MCSFGDASINHSTAAGALNAAGYAVAQGLPLPLLFVCEDNGIGISVPTPARLGRAPRPSGPASRTSPPTATTRTRRARGRARRPTSPGARRRPALLHLRTVRYLGHAGSDVESALPRRRPRSPPTASATRCWRWPGGSAAPAWPQRYADIADAHRGDRRRARRHADAARRRGGDGAAGPAPAAGALHAPRADDAARSQAFGGRLPEDAGPLTLAQSINAALDRRAGRPSGDAGVRRGRRPQGRRLRRHPRAGAALRRGPRVRHAARRAVDPRLRRSASASAGCCRCPRSSTSPTCTTPRTSCAARRPACASSPTARSPTRWSCASPGLAYQKGFGGHFHNDNAVARAARHPRPGRRRAGAPRGRRADAARLPGRGDARPGRSASSSSRSRSTTSATCTSPATAAGSAHYSPDARAPIGSARLHATVPTARDLTIVTFGNGVRMSLRVARRLAAEGIGGAGARPALDRPAADFDEICCAVSAHAGACWSPTRRGTPAASARACSPRWSRPASPGAAGAGRQPRQLRAAGRRREPGAARRGRHRARRPRRCCTPLSRTAPARRIS